MYFQVAQLMCDARINALGFDSAPDVIKTKA
jgi:hypothetical protein